MITTKIDRRPTLSERFPLRCVAMSAGAAQKFMGRTDKPTDLGAPIDAARYAKGAHVWGFAPPARNYGEEYARASAGSNVR